MYFSKVFRTNETLLNQLHFLSIKNKCLSLVKDKNIHKFEYDDIAVNTSQIDFYNKIILPYIKLVFYGKSASIFALGPRCCGKSYSFVGDLSGKNMDEIGCIYRGCMDLLANLSSYNSKKGLFMSLVYVCFFFYK
jgi:hypothetical protein